MSPGKKCPPFASGERGREGGREGIDVPKAPKLMLEEGR